MRSKIMSFKDNKYRIEHIFKTYLLCKFKIKNGLINEQEMKKCCLFCEKVDLILSTINSEESFFLKNTFIDKKQWYDFNSPRSTYFKKMGIALSNFNSQYNEFSKSI